MMQSLARRGGPFGNSIAPPEGNCKGAASRAAAGGRLTNRAHSPFRGGGKTPGEAGASSGGWIHFLRRPRRPSMLRLRSAIRPSEAVMNCLSLSSKI